MMISFENSIMTEGLSIDKTWVKIVVKIFTS